MATLEEYNRYFEPDEVPSVLVKLIEFAETKSDSFSQGFELECDSEDLLLRSYSEKPEFLNSLLEVGQADLTGSIYAIWRRNRTLDDAPVVAFGSEGGAHIVANNLLGLLRILTLDAEPIISWDKVTYYVPGAAEPTEGAADYAKWLAENFDQNSLKDAKEAMRIVEDAQTMHEKEFRNWFSSLAERK